MKYSEQAFERAEAELSRRRRNAERIHTERTAEISQLAPEIDVLQKSLANTGTQLIRLVMEKRDDTAEIIDIVKEKNLRTQEAVRELLEAVKGDKDYLDIPYTCKKCGDTGYIGGTRCDCFKKLLKNILLRI